MANLSLFCGIDSVGCAQCSCLVARLSFQNILNRKKVSELANLLNSLEAKGGRTREIVSNLFPEPWIRFVQSAGQVQQGRNVPS